ncbi:MAG: transcriptional repressor LexA [Planctomycetota bacterium]|nr:transcriptional repressor LexA [Planctomycetota bacterium]MCX8040262.1 transcriptional repressor LexA [Planctomycetota bacterium]MDW8372443.1 transcriptional repressor LexA [Planctomycetota bacterium]
MRALPAAQQRVLAAFADAALAGRPPTRAEVALQLGYAFPSAVSKHVEALVRKGLLRLERGKKRNVQLTEAGWRALGKQSGAGVPIVGAIAAGSPILAIEEACEFLPEIVARPGRMALRVRGDSMCNAGILDGDIAIIQQSDTVRDGEIAAVVVDGEATLKRWRSTAEGLELLAENPAYPPLVIPRARLDSVRLVGVLSFVVRMVR